MQKNVIKPFLRIVVALSFVFAINIAEAWDHEAAIGYGWGQEISENYQNHAIALMGKLYRFNKIDDTLFASIDGTLANIKADTDSHTDLTTAAVSLAMRAYFQNPDLHQIRPYVGVSFGPAYLSEKQLGYREQGSNMAFQTMFEGGMEFALAQGRSIDVGLHLIHYCNAGLAKPNQGIDIPYLLTIGYQF